MRNLMIMLFVMLSIAGYSQVEHRQNNEKFIYGHKAEGRIPTLDSRGRLVYVDPSGLGPDSVEAIILSTITGGYGIDFDPITGIITNTLPDQVVSLTAGAGISITGSYPSFTIAVVPDTVTMSDISAVVNQVVYGVAPGVQGQSANLQFNGTTLTTSNSAIFQTIRIGLGGSNIASNTVISNTGGQAITAGTQNVLIGKDVGLSLTTGFTNVMIGSEAGKNANSNGNVFIGYQAGTASTGSNNMIIGSGAGLSNTSGNNNLFLAASAGRLNTSGAYNVYMGSEAGYSNPSGIYNIAIGALSNRNQTSGSGNISIGTAVSVSNSTGSQQMNIGGVIYGTGLKSSLTLTSTPNAGGKIGIGVEVPTSTLDVAGDVEITSTASYIVGDPTTDGSWRMMISGANFVIQKRESGSWVTKHTFTP